MLPPTGALVLIMVAAMAVTPFLNNAATVLVMAPIAASFARQLGFKPDAFLMAVAIGAACDFLTPIGHQCNTLVMGPRTCWPALLLLCGRPGVAREERTPLPPPTKGKTPPPPLPPPPPPPPPPTRTAP